MSGGNGIVLKDYQQEAVDAYNKQKQLLLTLPPGAGKSYILFSVMDFPALVITYRYVIYEQQYQLKKFNPKLKTQHIKTGKTKLKDDIDVYYITPQLVLTQLPNIAQKGIKFIAVDESQMYKNLTSKQTKAGLALSSLFPNAGKMCMSGTPAPESVLDMYPQIQFVTDGKLEPYSIFTTRYASFRRTTWGEQKVYVTKKQSKNISQKFAPYVFTKDRSLLPLPDQELHHIPLQMPKKLRNMYDEYCEELSVTVDEEEILAINSPYTTMREISAGFITKDPYTKEKVKLSDEKYKHAKDICDTDDSQVIVWGNFRWELEKMYEVAGKDSRLVYGGISNGKQIIDDFKEGKFKILVANPECIGAGISLENCHRMVYLSLPVKGSSYVQSLARTNRVTQTQTEQVYFLHYVDSVEEIILHKTQNKAYNQETILKAIRTYKSRLKT